MKMVTLALGLILGTVASYASVSNLNYFVTDKKFNVNTNVGWSTTTTELTGSSDTDISGLGFGLTGLYGVSKATNAGFRVGYTSTETDNSNEETTGLEDIDLLYNWRFSNKSDAQMDLNFALSPKLGASEEDGDESNALRGSTLISVDWTRFAKINNNTEWNVTAGIDYYTVEETEDVQSNTSSEIEARTDLVFGTGIRYHNTEKVFIGGDLAFTLPGDIKNEATGATTTEFDNTIGLGFNAGYKINKTSNVLATLGYVTTSGTAGTADFDATGTSFEVEYVREF